MPELVRYPTAVAQVDEASMPRIMRLTPRERRLYLALAVLLSLNLTIICSVLTFFGLLFES